MILYLSPKSGITIEPNQPLVVAPLAVAQPVTHLYVLQRKVKRTKKNITFLLFFMSLSWGFAQEAPKLNTYPKEQVHIFLLAGQSNMAGRGNVEAVDKEVHPRLFTLSREGDRVSAIDPIHYDKPVAGVGLGRSFALRLLEQNEDIVIGLVPAACGGSPISTWEPGAYWEQTKSHPYDDAIKRVKRARQDGVLKGILWHQGEGDSNEKSSPNYAEKLRALIERFRDDLGVDKLPFIIGQLGQFEGNPWNDFKRQVNEAHASMPESRPNVGFVGSDGLRAMEDNIHFNAGSLRVFGRRYAEVYMEIVEQGGSLKADEPRE